MLADAPARADMTAGAITRLVSLRGDEKKFADSPKTLDNADTAYRKCFAAHAEGDPFFAAITKQAQELVDRVQ